MWKIFVWKISIVEMQVFRLFYKFDKSITIRQNGTLLENIIFMLGEGWRMFQLLLVLIGSMMGASIEHVEASFQAGREHVGHCY